MTIRAKLYAAIALTILGPLVTVAVALDAQSALGERFEEVQRRARHETVARELKFGVTDVNGWQTAYGYDSGRSRPRFEESVAVFRSDLATARRELREPGERALLAELESEFADFMALDAAAWRELQAGREEGTRRILLGPGDRALRGDGGNGRAARALRAAPRARPRGAPSTTRATTPAGG